MRCGSIANFNFNFSAYLCDTLNIAMCGESGVRSAKMIGPLVHRGFHDIADLPQHSGILRIILLENVIEYKCKKNNVLVFDLIN